MREDTQRITRSIVQTKHTHPQLAHYGRPMRHVQVWGAAEINLGYELSEDHKRILLLVLKVC